MYSNARHPWCTFVSDVKGVVRDLTHLMPG